MSEFYSMKFTKNFQLGSLLKMKVSMRVPASQKICLAEQTIPQAWFYWCNIFWCKMAYKKLRTDAVDHKVLRYGVSQGHMSLIPVALTSIYIFTRGTQLSSSFSINLGMGVFTTSADSLELVLDPLDLRYFGIKMEMKFLVSSVEYQPTYEIMAHLCRIPPDH
jgi:hypothetical protein